MPPARPSAAPPPPPSAPPTSPSGAPARPTRLGDYDVVAKIAGGGLSTIYLARKVSAPAAPPVALEVVRDDLSDDDHIVKMFLERSEPAFAARSPEHRPHARRQRRRRRAVHRDGPSTRPLAETPTATRGARAMREVGCRSSALPLPAELA
jgi:hypothetical protein